jgi:hypothetical protein
MKQYLVIAAFIFHCGPPAFGQDGSDAATVAAEKRLAAYGERVGGSFHGTFEAASRVEVKTGIGEYEAYVLSAAYLYAYIERCSIIHALRDDGDRWLAETHVGEPPGEPGPFIYVEKATGITYSPENKRVVDPKSYLQIDI